MSLQDIEDAFVNVTIDDQPRSAAAAMSHAAASEPKTAFQHWVQHNGAQTHDDEVYMFRTLQKLYPGHNMVTMQDYGGANAILQFPEIIAMPVDGEDQIIRASFVQLPRASGIPGLVAREPVFAVYNIFWKTWEFKYVIITFLYGYNARRTHFVIHKGSKSTVDELIVAAGAFAEKLHNEIWVYDNSWWEKDAGLYAEVQRADWKDVILKQEFKDTLRNDIEGFYTQEKVYKDLGIPWKRGIIMYGPPGNGKTISMKAIMKSAPATPLYVRNFNHYGGPEMAMKVVFAKARQLSPSLLILEDLDALITPATKSYFLNEVDGLDNNDGILIIGTTNYLERIDPALSKRPSRFDRKFLFDIPDQEERALYCKYWQHKLKSNKDLDFPDSLVQSIAEATEKFSFAFLKEVFVNTLVQLATGSEKRPFNEAVLATAEKLRKEIGSEDLKQMMLGGVTRDGVPVGQEQQGGPQGPRFARALHTHFRSLMEPSS